MDNNLNPTIDLMAINDEQELKALAYDAVAAVQVAQQNLQMVEQRLMQVKAGNSSKQELADKS